MTTRNSTPAGRLRIRLELEAALAKAYTRLARIECVLGALEAEQRRQRARARAEAQAIAVEYERAGRRNRLAQGLGVALLGATAAAFTASSRRHLMGLRELD